MKTEIVYTSSISEARKEMPWAAKIVKIEGGYKGFESLYDYKVWAGQE